MFPRYDGTSERHRPPGPIHVARFLLSLYAPRTARTHQDARLSQSPAERPAKTAEDALLTHEVAGKAGTDAAAAWSAPTWRGRVSLVGRDSYMRDLYPACNIGQWARAITDGNADVRVASRRAAPRAQRARVRAVACLPCLPRFAWPGLASRYIAETLSLPETARECLTRSPMSAEEPSCLPSQPR